MTILLNLREVPEVREYAGDVFRPLNRPSMSISQRSERDQFRLGHEPVFACR